MFTGAKKNNFFTGVLSGRVKCPLDDKGCLFIDRDPTLFEHVLEWLRTGTINASDHVRMAAIYKEAAHYGILLPPLAKIFEGVFFLLFTVSCSMLINFLQMNRKVNITQK